MKKMQLSILVLMLFMTGVGYAADKGKIAVAAEGKTVRSEVSGVAARCPYFLIFDTDGVLIEAIDNPFKGAKRGAGRSVVPFLAQKGVTVVVAGEFGRNMKQTMTEKGVNCLQFQGSVQAAIKEIQDGRQEESK